VSRGSEVAARELRPDLSLERAFGLIFFGLGGIAAAIAYFPARAWIVHRELGGLLLGALALATLLLASGLWLWSYGRREAARPLPEPVRSSVTCLLVLTPIAIDLGFAWLDSGRLTWRDIGGGLAYILLLALVLRRSLRRPDSRWSDGRS